MNYDIEYSCGHKGVVNLSCSTEEANKKLELIHDMAVCPRCYKDRKYGKKSVNQEKENDIKIPIPPDIIGWKKWNRKFYGQPGDWRIYIDWKRTSITDMVKEDLEKYLKDLEDFETSLAELQIKEKQYECN
jgi:hypothetical protein